MDLSHLPTTRVQVMSSRILHPLAYLYTQPPPLRRSTRIPKHLLTSCLPLLPEMIPMPHSKLYETRALLSLSSC